MAELRNPELFDSIIKKASLKQNVYRKTLSAFIMLKTIIQQMEKEYLSHPKPDDPLIFFEFIDKGTFEMELKFGSDVLVFVMHTNVFEFPRDHEVMKTNYVTDDKDRSYCGIIHIYNFLADSFKYNRVNDVGYLIGRILINKEDHYYLEGKREIGLLYNNFATSQINEESLSDVVRQAIMYTLNFDLLTPPYDTIKEVTVSDMQATIDNISLKTGKRLGFRFQADIER